MENWKPINLVDKGINWGDYYEVSTEGQIRNRKTQQIRKQNISNTGYKWVTLSKKLESGKRVIKWVHVHRMVALTFLPNPTGLPMVNHKDENKFNNKVENLEWCDVKYNNCYGTRIQRIQMNKSENRKSIPVAKIDRNGKVVKVYESINAAAAIKENPSYISIYRAVFGMDGRKTAGGFIWKKVEVN